jgi:hypothetical protein
MSAPAQHTPLVERLRAKRQVLPAFGSATITSDGRTTSYITDDGKRLVNPDGPEAADTITELLEALEAWVTYSDRDDDGHDTGEQMMLDYATALSLTRAAIARARGGAS